MSEKIPEKSKLAQREEEILEFWKRNEIFKKSLEKPSVKGEFVFYEGPPTANGKPAIHHLEARSFKDVIPRYKTMQGFHVRRKAGWDTHGLPVELAVEKELGLTSKKDIEKYGVAEFNKKCKQSVLRYIEEWDKFTDRMGYWVDRENAYFTFQNSYIESVWNIVKKIDEQKLLYKDYKVVPWCPRCGTGLSSHELAQGYETTKDLAVFVKFKIKNLKFKDTYILAWTTTPWTLPGNVALAVGEDIEYVKIKIGEEFLILAKARLETVKEEYEIVEEMKGKDLIGLEYEPLYVFLKDNLPESEKEKLEKAFKVYSADFVTTEDGTGVVHTAVMYGQDDFALGNKIGLPKFHLVKEDGTFIPETVFLAGRFVKDEETAVEIIKDLAHRGLLFKKEKYEHSYPHCWRCKTPLIYFARDSWYIRMSSLRDKLISENEKINWEPSYIKEGRFGEWLKDVKDWAISRERYWGTPLPVWITEDGSLRVVVDSIETLKKYTRKSGNKYFLMRHGEAEHNVKNVLSSDNEASHPLTEKGREDAKESAKILKDKKIDLIIYSPLLRTKETAEIVKGIIGVPTLEDARIREEEFGYLSGKPWTEIAKVFPTFSDRLYKKVEGLETLIEVKQRMGDFLYEIEQKYQNKNILVVTHDGPASAMLCIAKGVSDCEIEDVYKPGKDSIPVGKFIDFDFVPLPHDEEYRLDLHKPYIDEIELVTKDGRKLTRVKEVMDVWFDSGAMPFAEDHYPFDFAEGKPFENKELAYPADFISEAIDQTRGWFYTLHAIGVLSGKGRAYKNVICLGHLNDKDGKKMSKSLGNVINPDEMINKYGVDALRLWMYSVNQPGESKNFDEKTVDEIVKKNFNLLSNVLTFYELYRELKVESGELKEINLTYVLDKWILAKLFTLIETVTKNMDEYKVLEPVRAIREFIDDLSTWYLQLSRDRFRDGNAEAKKTLYFVLKNLSKVLAPFAPFYAESLYQSLKRENEEESVHLCKWPVLEALSSKPQALKLLENMETTQKIVSIGLKARSSSNIPVRQQLGSLTVSEKYKIPPEYQELVKERVNIEKIIFTKTNEEVILDTQITPALAEKGKTREIIRAIQDLRKKQGLSPKDIVSLKIDANEAGKNLLSKEEVLKEIKKAVLAEDIDICQVSGDNIQIDDITLSVEIKNK